ncbi:MAG: hypothetical protein UX68_C0032G0029 [Parcubacteria group bacterium GW2011_GWA2_46_9]|nr:MAG: hypothetical protein UX68_C0032G0029 [Parcubacteria group bacterium GW2011_GWA2_46_9]
MLVSRWGRQPIKKKWPTLNYPTNRRNYSVRGFRSFKRYFVALFLLFSVYFFIYSSIFDINRIIILGNATINAKIIEDIVDQIKKEKRWFIFPQKNILFFDDNFLKSELMNNIHLDSVQIKKRPWGTLYISISEKTAVASDILESDRGPRAALAEDRARGFDQGCASSLELCRAIGTE